MNSIEESDVKESCRTAFITSVFAAYTVFVRCLAERVAGFFEELCVFFYNSLHSVGTFTRAAGKKTVGDYTDLRGYLSIRSSSDKIDLGQTRYEIIKVRGSQFDMLKSN